MKNTRRDFVKTVSIGSIGTLGLGMAACSNNKEKAGAAGIVWPSDKINVAVVGAAGMGGGDLRQMNKTGMINVVALCDVDWGERQQKTFNEFPNAKKYKDFRVMLEKEKDIEAVVVGVPDHNHAVITMAALDLGKHVYCEKPLAHSIDEVQKMTKRANEVGVITQMGNQGHSWDTIREIVEIVNAGIIGDVTEVVAWCDRPAGGGSVSFPHGIVRPTGDYKVPKTLDWDLWIGPAQYRPYHPLYAPQKWRGFIDFGCGALGDFGCHTLDPCFWALDLGSPESIIASTTDVLEKVDYDTYPTSSIIEYTFPERGEKPPVKLTWYDGGMLPVMDERFKDIKFGTNGAILVGEKGMIQHGSHGGNPYKVMFYDGSSEFEMPAPTIERVTDGNHRADWLNAIKAGTQPSGNFNYGGPLSETVLLGVTAGFFRNQRIKWDAEKMRVSNLEEANAIIYPEYREGWKI